MYSHSGCYVMTTVVYVQEWVFRNVNFLLVERGLLRHSCSFTVIR